MKDGVNIFVVSKDTKREDMPKEIGEMLDLVDSLVSNTARICKEKNMSITLLPSIYLHAFNKVAPLIIEPIIKANRAEEAQIFLDGLKTIVDGSFKV